jgi:hypothetical protein
MTNTPAEQKQHSAIRVDEDAKVDFLASYQRYHDSFTPRQRRILRINHSTFTQVMCRTMNDKMDQIYRAKSEGHA